MEYDGVFAKKQVTDLKYCTSIKLARVNALRRQFNNLFSGSEYYELVDDFG